MWPDPLASKHTGTGEVGTVSLCCTHSSPLAASLKLAEPEFVGACSVEAEVETV